MSESASHGWSPWRGALCPRTPPATVRDYGAILSLMCLLLADREAIEVSIDDLRDVIDTWAVRSARTRQEVTSVVRSFWGWMEERGHIAISPAARIRRPKAELARTLPPDARPRLLAAAKHPRDRLGLFCLLVLGARRTELAGIQIRDFDAQHGNADLTTTLSIYGRDDSDLEHAMEQYAAWLEPEAPSVPPEEGV